MAATARAEEMVVEGRALIGADGLAAARGMATRRALARAAESHSAQVSAQSRIQEGMALESAQVNASACTREVQPLTERVDGDELTVALRVQVDACDAARDGADGAQACGKAYTNRVLVTGFAFEFPEQLLAEWDGRLLPSVNRQRIEALTATELSHALVRDGHVLAVFDGDVFPYASPARAPALHIPAGSVETPLAARTRERQAQYALSGIYREFGLEKKLKRHERLIEIEAFLHDGVNGAVLARRRFQTKVSGSILSDAFSVFNTPTIGTSAFRKTPFGKKWTTLIDDIARWAGAQASCLPFIARVMKVDGHRLQLDAGAESGISPGDTMVLHILRQPPVFDLSTRLLGQEKQVRATALIHAVYPAFSIAELVETPVELKVAPGDLVYTQ
ncbi:MAG: flagellar assembly protein T N-terminal domain-containing protein [Azoarcus sp.]|nr:flagellar assembly protein T N-terminal domain-containing protein [Azoarcus sp.]